MNRAQNEQRVRNGFAEGTPRLSLLAGRFVDDPDAVVEQAAKVFDDMIPEMAYIDAPDHPMADSVFICNANLALYLVLKDRGVDVHDYGNAMLDGLTRAPAPEPQTPADGRSMRERFAEFVAIAEQSKNAKPGEFVYEAFLGDRSEYDWGMNVTSCAICASFSQHDAMDLVPYMCATDDVMSDKGAQGLRRNGSIAVGAHQCDFRYQRGGEPQRLAAQYPERIRVVEQS